MTISGQDCAISLIALSAALVRNVTSIVLMPPSKRAFANGTASFASSMTMTGMTGPRDKIERRFAIYISYLMTNII